MTSFFNQGKEYKIKVRAHAVVHQDPFSLMIGAGDSGGVVTYTEQFGYPSEQVVAGLVFGDATARDEHGNCLASMFTFIQAAQDVVELLKKETGKTYEFGVGAE